MSTISTISSPQFINLEPFDVNPGMSKCEIKVLYVGQNRNYSYITKEVATEMSKTLRGAPIVGYYKKEKQDFRDHGERIIIDSDMSNGSIIDDEGIQFECLTKPYGFVGLDAPIWFQTFVEPDSFGNDVEREYLMTTGYLWTGQFEECQSVIKDGKGQSMELDENTLQGHWETDYSTGLDFFIINDASFTKLCILGDDVEPCFEGASITAPNISLSFSYDEDFKTKLNQMYTDLLSALKQEEKTMIDKEKVLDENVETNFSKNEVSTEAEKTVITNFDDGGEGADGNSSETETETETTETEGTEEPEIADPAEEGNNDASDPEPAKGDGKEEGEGEGEGGDDPEPEPPVDPDIDESIPEAMGKKKLFALQTQYNELMEKYTSLEKSYNELLAFKKNIDDKEKDAMIAQFYMLSEEDLKDVRENKSNYTVDEIESKLATICFRKHISFDNVEEKEENTEDKSVITTFNLDNETISTDNTPDWIKAVEEVHKQRIF